MEFPSTIFEIILESQSRNYLIATDKRKIEKAKREAQTLESILITVDCECVTGKDGENMALPPRH
ncbi:hypothetical protein RND71_003169 [Anisodus tanguticus]|uniref:Uncharacterized protein n=1 Tax=Anisodus tanguticus TaxID=243964 RepID=A0AAE1SST6_9SOLA|nr:hypothetical protein RND71_003169 [Anisodus tanguticus]